MNSQTRGVFFLIFMGVLVWGLLLAFGAFRGADPVGANPMRGLIVLAGTTGFLGIWLLLLRRRAKAQRQRRDSTEDLSASDPSKTHT